MSKESDERLQKEYNEALRAEKIMNDPLVVEALAEIESELFKDFKRTKFFQDRKRKAIHEQINQVDWFKEAFYRKMVSIELLQKRLEAKK